MASKAQQKKQKKVKDEVQSILTLPSRQNLTEMMAGVVGRSKSGQLKSHELAFFSQFQKIKVIYLKLADEIEHLKLLHKQAQASNDDGPTPETVAKKKTSAIQYLVDCNRITPEELQAAKDISEAYEIITGPVRCKVFKYEERVGYSEPRDMTPREITLKNTFNEWMSQMLTRRYSTSIAHDAIIKAMSLNDLQQSWGGRKETITEQIKQALDLYCSVVKACRGSK